MHTNYGVIVLAAGSSSRLGRPKQLLTVNNQTLLQRIIDAAISLHAGPVLVVLSENSKEYIKPSDGLQSIINTNAAEGMASSVRAGIEFINESFPEITGALIVVCDQPYVDSSILKRILSIYEEERTPIVASSYNNTLGTPVFFHRSIFPELLELEGDRGAKSVVSKDPNRVSAFDFSEGDIDIDTEEDYRHFIDSVNK